MWCCRNCWSIICRNAPKSEDLVRHPLLAPRFIFFLPGTNIELPLLHLEFKFKLNLKNATVSSILMKLNLWVTSLCLDLHRNVMIISSLRGNFHRFEWDAFFTINQYPWDHEENHNCSQLPEIIMTINSASLYKIIAFG